MIHKELCIFGVFIITLNYMIQQTINVNTTSWVLDLKSQKKFCECKVWFFYNFFQ
jgi:hypothetical protein